MTIKCRLISDLHLEGGMLKYEFLGEDVLVLAGDISSRPELYSQYVAQVPDSVEIVAIAGNHEYYKHNMDEHKKVLKDLGYLHNEIKVVGDVHFICGTMWTDFRLDGIHEEWFAKAAAAQGITDFVDKHHGIRKNNTREEWRPRMFTTHDAQEEFFEFERFLQWALKETEGKKRVVVTHFMPHRQAIDPKYRMSTINAYFCSDMERYMGWEGVWCAGHTHSSCDFMVGETRVLINPKGYGKENINGFNPNLIFEI
jgi:predicted phosphodiesterase